MKPSVPQRIAFTPIAEGSERTPDYEVTLRDERVIIEVKEIKKNKAEKESDRVLAQRKPFT